MGGGVGGWCGIEGRTDWLELQFAQRRRFRFPCNKENHLQTAQIFRPAREQIKKKQIFNNKCSIRKRFPTASRPSEAKLRIAV